MKKIISIMIIVGVCCILPGKLLVYANNSSTDMQAKKWYCGADISLKENGTGFQDSLLFGMDRNVLNSDLYSSEDKEYLDAPQNLTYELEDTVVHITWDASENNEIIYKIFKDDESCYTTKYNRYTDYVQPDGQTYTIIAYDPTKNIYSLPSQPLQINSAGIDISVVNGDFEKTLGNDPVSDWDQFYQGYGKIDAAEIYIEEQGNQCLSISGTNDSLYYQTVRGLTPGRTYILSGRVKSKTIIVPPESQNATGQTSPSIAVILVNENGETSDWIYNTDMKGSFPRDYLSGFDWTDQEVEFIAPSSGTVHICCALGDYWANYSGQFLFDDIKLMPKLVNTIESKYIRFNFTNEDLRVISKQDFDYWSNELDKVYMLYWDLIGQKHNEEHKLLLNSNKSLPYYGTADIPGNIINWNAGFIHEEFLRIKNYSYNFGLLHEISHMYDIGDWAWHAEMAANFKMLYALYELEKEDPKVYTYRETINERYKSSYEQVYQTGIYTEDGFTYLLSKVVDEVGWDVFKTVYRTYLEENISPKNGLEKVNMFLYLIQKEARTKAGLENYNIINTISQSDLQIVREFVKEDNILTDSMIIQSADCANLNIIFNTSMNDKKLVVSVYDKNDELKQILLPQLEQDVYNAELYIDPKLNAKRIKIMVWDSLEQIQPLGDYEEINL